MICLNCGRRLRSAASREAGYGPVCYKKLFGASLRIRSGRKAGVTKKADSSCDKMPGQISMDDYLRKLSME